MTQSFFAGQALYEGEAFGTVEAALTNGKEVVSKIMKRIKIANIIKKNGGRIEIHPRF